MKLKFWDRLVLFFGALLTILSGGMLLVLGLQIQGIIGESLPLWCRVLCVACGVLAILFGGYLILLPWKYSKTHKHEFVVQRTENGELRIAVKAIENLVQKCIDMHSEVRVLSMNILNDRDGVLVDLNISLANNISIPLAVAALQKQIKQYLVASAGIEVTEVRVSVETAQVEADPSSYLEEEEIETDAPEDKAEKKDKPEKAPEAAPVKKLPLHQRLFGRQDQPATLPEPPQPEPDIPEPAEDEEAGPEDTVNAENTADETPADGDQPAAGEEAPPSSEGDAQADDVQAQEPETEDEPHA
ncbi:MAG: alkaline shock response membrane anchor protein AmaP [Clostridia bacterium]|nr:alkaline shock response membrane anchor protein AmaP [Clostridia bacterium]